jgi:hypothetical protein
MLMAFTTRGIIFCGRTFRRAAGHEPDGVFIAALVWAVAITGYATHLAASALIIQRRCNRARWRAARRQW